MLNYNLEALVGPRCNDLRIENKEKYDFNLRQLLSDIVQVYLNLSKQPKFIFCGSCTNMMPNDRGACIFKEMG